MTIFMNFADKGLYGCITVVVFYKSGNAYEDARNSAKNNYIPNLYL